MSFIDRDDRQGDLFAPPPAADDDVEHDGHLAIGVWPTDCRNILGVRPCPYVRCRHHLLLDEVYSDDGQPAIAINRARDPRLVQVRPVRGRREELEASPDAGTLEGFMVVALERLWELPDTCSREVARRAHLATEDAPPGDPAMTFPEIAEVLGVGDPDELAEEFADLRAGLRGEVIGAGGDPDVDEDAVTAIAGRGTINPRR